MKNKRFWLCVQYNLKRIAKPMLIFLGMFIVTDVIINVFDQPLYQFISPNQLDFLGIDMLFGLAHHVFGYTFLVSPLFLFIALPTLFIWTYIFSKENMKHMLLMNNTKVLQFWASSVSMIISSAVLTICGLIIGIYDFVHLGYLAFRINDDWSSYLPESMKLSFFEFLNLSQTNYTQIHINYIEHFLMSQLFIFLMILLSFSFGEFISSLSDRFRRKIAIPFWTISIALAITTLTIFIVYDEYIFNQLLIMQDLGQQLSQSILILAITVIIFKLITFFLNIRRLPQAD